MNVCGSPLSGFVIDLKGNLALGRIWLKPKCFKCNFICSHVLWKSLHWNLFCSSPLFHFPVRKLLFGSILGVISVSFSLFPPVNAMPSKNGFTPHVLRDGGCFHFYPLFKKWKELRNWHFKNWWVRLRMACGEEWSGEWANGETRETDWLCSERAQFDCFLSVWVEAADATSASPNMDIHKLVLQDFSFFFFFF